MGAAVPSLGYRSRTEAVLALREQGHSTKQIARQVGISESNVTALEATKARRMRAAPPAATLLGRAVVLHEDILKQLRRPAARRGLSANELARLIVETVVSSGLIDAVLDDEVEK